MKIIKIGCNGLIIKDKKILLGIRTNIYGEGTYGLPGGHLEYGEKLIEATKREIFEECGVEATDLVFNSTIDEVRVDQHYIQVNFVVNRYDGVVKNGEPDRCKGWEWFDLDNLPENIFPPHVSIIQAYKQKQLYSY